VTAKSTRARLASRVLATTVTLPWLGWAVIRTFRLESTDLLVSAISFTPYVALTSPVPVLVAAVLRRWGIAALALVPVGMLAAAVLPRAIADSQPETGQGAQTLVVMSVNLHDGRADPLEIMRLVREEKVDLLCMLEVGSAIPRLDAAGAKRLLPGRVLAPRARAGGSALLVRRGLALTTPIRDESEQPSATISFPAGHKVSVEAIHTPPPTNHNDALAWRRTLENLPAAGKGRDLRLLVGDFNGTLDHREVRHLLNRGYGDAADETGSGLRSTWPVDSSRPPITIDHILTDDRIAVREFRVHEIGGTDHRAIIATVVLPRQPD